MNCREAQQLMGNFIDDKMDDETLEAFIEHVKNCPSCYDDLEVYYMVITGIRQLDEGEDTDFINGLKNKLKDKEAWLKRRKKVRVRKWICACAAFFLLIAGTGVFFLFQYMEASERERIMTRIQHSVYAFFGDTPTPAREHQAEERSDVKIDDFAGKGRTVYFRYVQIDGRQRLVPEELPDIEIMYETDSRDQEDGK